MTTMMRRSARRAAATIAIAGMLCGLPIRGRAGETDGPASRAADTGNHVADPDVRAALRQSMEAFWNAEYAAAETIARSIAGRPAAGKDDLVEAQKCLACVYVMRKERRQALDSLVQMFQLDPTARFSPDAHYPPPVVRTYYEVKDSLFVGTVDVKTVAVGDFENNSIYTGTFKDLDFGALSRALPHLITLDLAEATDLKIVDRQRTAEILKELAISESGIADPRMAVKAGQLLGAHAYIFGQYMVLSKDRVRIDARIVRTATGEVVTARQITAPFGGKPEVFLEIEKRLIGELMRALDLELGADISGQADQRAEAWFGERSKRLKGRDGYVEGLFRTSAALDAESRGDWAAAIAGWKQVAEADPGNEVARIRIQVLEQTIRQS